MGGKYTRFMYDGGNIIGELTEGNYYIYHRGTELIGSESYDGKSYYFRQDSHGNVTGILDIFGSEVKNYSYNPYGGKENIRLDPMGDQTIIYQWKAETDKVYNPFGFCGEYFDEETGLIYLRNRYYNPNTGRFITEDPAKDGFNWYVYCENNPIMFVDPWGLYDREAAVEYAKTWAFGTNSDKYERFDTSEMNIIERKVIEIANEIFGTSFYAGDCANFVSQCLVAGGLEMNSFWHYEIKKREEWHGNNSVVKKERDMTTSWSVAKEQYDFFSSDWAGYKEGGILQVWTKEGLKTNIDYYNIQPGDLMYFASKNNRIVHHATIISKVDENEIYYAAHSGNHKEEPLSPKLSNEMVFIVRIRDNAKKGYVE